MSFKAVEYIVLRLSQPFPRRVKSTEDHSQDTVKLEEEEGDEDECQKDLRSEEDEKRG